MPRPWRDRYNVILFGTYGSRPEKGDLDQIYIVSEGTNLGRWYHGNGTTWDEIPIPLHALDPASGPHTGTLPKAKVAGLKCDSKIFVQDTDPAADPANGVVHGDLWIQRVTDSKAVQRAVVWVRYETGETKRWDNLGDLLDGYHASEFMLNTSSDKYASAVGAPHSYVAKSAVLAGDSDKVDGYHAATVMVLAAEIFGD